MKHLIFIGLTLLVTTQVQCQTLGKEPIIVDKPSKQFFLKCNPLATIQGPVFGVGEARLGIEMVASPKITSEISVSYLFKSPLYTLLASSVGIPVNNIEFPGYRFQGQVRYYYLKFNTNNELSKVLLPSGLYVALHSSYSSATIKDKRSVYPQWNYTLFNANVLGGIQALYKDHFGIDFFMGMGYKNNVLAGYDIYGNKRIEDPADFGHLPYFSSPVKFSMGFSLTFGLF
jgi:hypothetical protein